MKKPQPTKDEAERVAELESFDVLDTLPEQSFDDITAIASYICETPIALVSLVDSDRQWFKSTVGLDASETPRDVAFCAHAIHQDDIFQIPDAKKDDRFHDNPLVTGAPNVIFYAGAPLKTSNGHNVGTLCVIDHAPKKLRPEQQDALMRLARQVADQLEYRRMAQEAEQATKAKSQFLANMSHELRTPLNAIIGYSELLIEEIEDDSGDPGTIDDLQKIRSSGQHLLSLINQILDLSKVEAGRLEIYREDIDLHNLIDEAQTLTLPMVEKNENTLSFTLPEKVSTIHADQDKIKQIMVNLISNAAKFTTKGTITVSLDLASDSQLKIAVKDSGIGIPKDQQELIFQEFKQADDSTTRNYGGTGLGLSLCKKFAELMGGSIRLESKEGQGSVFEVLIPLNQASKTLDEDTSDISDASRPIPSSAKGPEVLIIDDDKDAREVTRRVLENQGYVVHQAHDGEQGVKLAHQLQPSMILLDVMMPNKDGWQTLVELKKETATKNIPVIMMTMVENQKVGYSLGASDYLVKPVRKDDLLAALKLRMHSNSTSVLVVDDDDVLRKMVTRSLGRAGLKVYQARNGKEAIQQIEKQDEIEVVLLDLMMPEMNGFEFLEEVRKRGWDEKLEIIVLSAKTLDKGDRSSLNEIVHKVAQKGSVSSSQLIADIQKLMKKNLKQQKKAA